MNLSLKGFQGLSAPAKAHPAFVAHAFDLINLSTAWAYFMTFEVPKGFYGFSRFGANYF